MTTTIERPAAVGQACILRRAKMDRLNATIIAAVARLPYPPSFRELAEIVGRTDSSIHYRLHYSTRNVLAGGWLEATPGIERSLRLGPRFAGLDNRDDWPLELVKA